MASSHCTLRRACGNTNSVTARDGPGNHPGARLQTPPKQPFLADPSKRVPSPALLSPLRPSPDPSLAQRVVLYEEDAADPAGQRFIGSAMWRTETATSGTEQSLVLRANLAIPERRLAITISICPNTSEAFRVTHTVEITVSLPTDFLFGGVNSVPGLLMKEAEATKGAPLSGLAVKVTPTFYLLGLSATETEKQRNLELLRDRAWLDIPIVYSNGRRAIISVEKGTSGERAFNEAFAAWGQ